MKREIAKSRPESRPRPRQRREFFLGFMFEPRNQRELSNFTQTLSRCSRNISTAFAIQLDRCRGQYTPRPNSPPAYAVKKSPTCTEYAVKNLLHVLSMR
jgi:hypothetical protein